MTFAPSYTLHTLKKEQRQREREREEQRPSHHLVPYTLKKKEQRKSNALSPYLTPHQPSRQNTKKKETERERSNALLIISSPFIIREDWIDDFFFNCVQKHHVFKKYMF